MSLPDLGEEQYPAISRRLGNIQVETKTEIVMLTLNDKKWSYILHPQNCRKRRKYPQQQNSSYQKIKKFCLF